MIIETKNIVLKSFYDFWRAYRENRYTFYILKGGRNSAKSTTASERFILDMIEEPINGLCIRKVDRTLQESVYEQLKEAIMFFDLQEKFSYSHSPLKITYLPRGNYILFRGADDPLKLKSIKTADFPIARVWIEELTEFKTEEEIQTIVDSILRAQLPEKLQYKFIYTYNPPRRKQHWVNKKYESQIIPDNTYVHSSSYIDNPYLPQQTLDEIENVKVANFKKYEWNYLGKVTGGGIVPFDNLIFRTILNDELKSFDNIRQGLDWGYASDPFAFVKMHYDKTRRKLYFIDEIYGTKLSNRFVADEIKKRKCEATLTIADSAEPKSIDELKSLGVKIVGAKKGEGSVEYGEKWLDDLTEIIIDPKRTPNVAREFESIDYEVDRDGNQKPKLEDKNNHTIDCARYGCESDMQSKNKVVSATVY